MLERGRRRKHDIWDYWGFLLSNLKRLGFCCCCLLKKTFEGMNSLTVEERLVALEARFASVEQGIKVLSIPAVDVLLAQEARSIQVVHDIQETQKAQELEEVRDLQEAERNRIFSQEDEQLSVIRRWADWSLVAQEMGARLTELHAREYSRFAEERNAKYLKFTEVCAGAMEFIGTRETVFSARLELATKLYGTQDIQHDIGDLTLQLKKKFFELTAETEDLIETLLSSGGYNQWLTSEESLSRFLERNIPQHFFHLRGTTGDSTSLFREALKEKHVNRIWCVEHGGPNGRDRNCKIAKRNSVGATLCFGCHMISSGGFYTNDDCDFGTHLFFVSGCPNTNQNYNTCPVESRHLNNMLLVKIPQLVPQPQRRQQLVPETQRRQQLVAQPQLVPRQGAQLDTLHFRTLQALCRRGGVFHSTGAAGLLDFRWLNRSADEWMACHSEGAGCAKRMVASIKAMIND